MKNNLQITTHDFLIYRDDNDDIKVNGKLVRIRFSGNSNLTAKVLRMY